LKLIGLTGPAGVGKTTLAYKIATQYGTNVVVKSYADPLRRMVATLTGCTEQQLRDAQFKTTEFMPGITYRQLLQTLGTEWGRKTIKNSLWTDIFAKEIGTCHGCSIIVDDVRFDNEAQLIRDLGGSIVFLRRCWFSYSGTHESEKGVTFQPAVDGIYELTPDQILSDAINFMQMTGIKSWDRNWRNS